MSRSERWMCLALLIFLSGCRQSTGVAAGAVPTDRVLLTAESTEGVATATNRVTSEPSAVTSGTKVPATAPAEWLVTRPPPAAYVPPAAYSKTPSIGGVWFGRDSLWTDPPANGVWDALPLEFAGYSMKVFWWRKGYSWTAEPEPNLTVSGRRLDAPAPALIADKSTNAYSFEIQ